jgi:hypothetical protein
VGKSLYARMSIVLAIEQEAEAFVKGKQTQFKEALKDYLDSLELYLKDNLHSCQEREAAIFSLTEAVLWSKHCAEVHGVK